MRVVAHMQANKPVMGIVQDTLLGCRQLTKRDSFIEKDLFMNIMLWQENYDGRVPVPSILKPKALWTGKQVRGREEWPLSLAVPHARNHAPLRTPSPEGEV
jgi:DNA-directed RNA polymerase beta' subunit